MNNIMEDKYTRMLALIPDESAELQARWDEMTTNIDSDETEEVLQMQIEAWNDVHDADSLMDYIYLFHAGEVESDAEFIMEED